PEPGARVPADRRQDLQPRRLPRRGCREPDPPRAQVPRHGGVRRRRDGRARRDREAGPGGRRGDGRGGAAGWGVRGLTVTITVTPDPFRLVPYHTATVHGLAVDAARVTGFPDDVDVALEIDEVLPHPLTGTFVDVLGDPPRVDMWMSGANFEDPKRPLQFQHELARAELVRAF